MFTPIVYEASVHTLIPTGSGAVRSGSLLEVYIFLSRLYWLIIKEG